LAEAALQLALEGPETNDNQEDVSNANPRDYAGEFDEKIVGKEQTHDRSQQSVCQPLVCGTIISRMKQKRQTGRP